MDSKGPTGWHVSFGWFGKRQRDPTSLIPWFVFIYIRGVWGLEHVERPYRGGVINASCPMFIRASQVRETVITN